MNSVFMLMKCLVVATYNLILVPLAYNFFFFFFFHSIAFLEAGKEGEESKGI